jgi:methylenetetrahydrofolate reductase (NADPH)
MKPLPPISFEVFPPKTPQGVENLYTALKDLSEFSPAYVSVTYGAMGTTRELTRELALGIRARLGIETVPHFTCVGSTRAEISAYLNSLKAAGIEKILALRGDPPQGETQFVRPIDGFAYANELVAYIRGMNGFRIWVAGYPEGHIEAPSREVDLENLKRKVDAGADGIITQLFFDNRDFFDFVERCRKIGIVVPIVPGIMPILNTKQISRIASMCGAKLPAELCNRLEACGDDAEAMAQTGIEWALAQVRGLIDRGVPGIHFYILNQARSVRGILDSL